MGGYGNSRIAFGTTGYQGVTLSQDAPKNRYELKGGVQAELAKNWNLWGHVGWRTGNNDYNRLEGQVGVKYLW